MLSSFSADSFPVRGLIPSLGVVIDRIATYRTSRKCPLKFLSADTRWLAVKVLVERGTAQQVMDDLEKIGCTAILETALRHTRL